MTYRTIQDRIEEFDTLGRQASFHYADDRGKEWSQAKTLEAQARALFDQHPDLQKQMRELARGFLWTL